MFLTTFAVYALITPRVLKYTEPPTGDQPYYLQTAISLLEDHDIDEHNNYLQGDYRRFYPPDPQSPQFQGIPALAPLSSATHLGKTLNRPQTEWYSKHGLGLPLLILPGWVLGEQFTPLLHSLTANGRGGWPGVVFELNVLGALLAVQVLVLVWQTTHVRWIALVVTATLAFANPQMAFSFLVFPELPAALFTVYAFRRLLLGWKANKPWQLLLAGACIAFLPWLHARLLAVALPLAALGLRQCWLNWRGQRAAAPAERGGAEHSREIVRALLFLAPLLLSASLLAAYYLVLYGTPLPNAQDHAGFLRPWVAGEWQALLAASLGVLLDQQWGLLVYAPVLVLTVAGCVAMWKQAARRGWLLWMLAVVVPYGLVAVAYRVWWGAWGPPARYLMPVTPLLALPLGQALFAGRQSKALLAVFAGLAAFGVAVMAAMIVALQPATKEQPPAFFNFNSGHAALFLWLRARLGVDLVPYYPGIVPWFLDPTYPMPWLLALIHFSLVAALACLGAVLVAHQLARPRAAET